MVAVDTGRNTRTVVVLASMWMDAVVVDADGSVGDADHGAVISAKGERTSIKKKLTWCRWTQMLVNAGLWRWAWARRQGQRSCWIPYSRPSCYWLFRHLVCSFTRFFPFCTPTFPNICNINHCFSPSNKAFIMTNYWWSCYRPWPPWSHSCSFYLFCATEFIR